MKTNMRTSGLRKRARTSQVRTSAARHALPPLETPREAILLWSSGTATEMKAWASWPRGFFSK